MKVTKTFKFASNKLRHKLDMFLMLDESTYQL